MNVTSRLLVISTLALILIAGCRTRIPLMTVSGIYAPDLPPAALYDTPLAPAPGGTASVAPVGVRLAEGRQLLIDVMVWSADDLIAERAADGVVGFARSGGDDLIGLRDDSGLAIELTDWRTAMHEQIPSMDHFSVHETDASLRLPDRDGQSRFLITFMMESRPKLEPGTVRCSLSETVLLEYHDYKKEALSVEYGFSIEVSDEAPIPVRRQEEIERAFPEPAPADAG